MVKKMSITKEINGDNLKKQEKRWYAYVETAACKKAWIDKCGELYGDKAYADVFSNIDAAKEAIEKAEILCIGFGNKILRKVIVNGDERIELC